jgi:hypothetical protein
MTIGVVCFRILFKVARLLEEIFYAEGEPENYCYRCSLYHSVKRRRLRRLGTDRVLRQAIYQHRIWAEAADLILIDPSLHISPRAMLRSATIPRNRLPSVWANIPARVWKTARTESKEAAN